jgi:hypothetical protein
MESLTSAAIPSRIHCVIDSPEIYRPEAGPPGSPPETSRINSREGMGREGVHPLELEKAVPIE